MILGMLFIVAGVAIGYSDYTRVPSVDSIGRGLTVALLGVVLYGITKVIVVTKSR